MQPRIIPKVFCSSWRLYYDTPQTSTTTTATVINSSLHTSSAPQASTTSVSRNFFPSISALRLTLLTYRRLSPSVAMSARGNHHGGRGSRRGGGGRTKAPPTREESISRLLSYLLRHHAKNEGVKYDDGGWANVADVVRRNSSLHIYFSLPMSFSIRKLHVHFTYTSRRFFQREKKIYVDLVMISVTLD